jgi:hypothetical protein
MPKRKEITGGVLFGAETPGSLRSVDFSGLAPKATSDGKLAHADPEVLHALGIPGSIPLDDFPPKDYPGRDEPGFIRDDFHPEGT